MILNSLNDGTFNFLQSAPIKVYMAGFVSDTLTMAKNGWQLSVDTYKDYNRGAIQTKIAFKHDGIKQVALGIMDFDERQILSNIHNSQILNDWFRGLGIQINYIAPMIRIIEIPMMKSIGQWSAIDPTPSVTNYKYHDLESLAVFKPIKTDDNFEIYINQKDELEILEILLKKQDLKQKEIKQNMKRRAYNSGQELPCINDKINTDIKHQIILCG